MKIVRYGVISDTHGRLHPRVFKLFDGVERIYHCGDIGKPTVAIDLETIAPLRAVRGNCDPWTLAGQYQEQVVDDAPFGPLVMYHGARYGHDSQAVVRGLAHHFKDLGPRLVLFGHTHDPVLLERNGVLFLNPGSATLPHRGEPATIALVEYDPDKDSLTARHISL